MKTAAKPPLQLLQAYKQHLENNQPEKRGELLIFDNSAREAGGFYGVSRLCYTS